MFDDTAHFKKLKLCFFLLIFLTFLFAILAYYGRVSKGVVFIYLIYDVVVYYNHKEYEKRLKREVAEAI